MALRLKANRRFPSVPVVTDNTENHTQVLMAVKEALDIGQRRTGDLFNSFIRVEDLVDLGLITIEGNTNAIVGADLSEIANIGDLSGAALGDFLRFDGTNWVNLDLLLADITQAMVVQHQAALAINWTQLTGTVPALIAPALAPVVYTSSQSTLLTDAYKGVVMNAAGANNYTIEPNATIAHEVGCVINVYQLGAGQTTLVPGAGVTFEYDTLELTTNIRARYCTASVWQRATDIWVLSGDLEPI